MYSQCRQGCITFRKLDLQVTIKAHPSALIKAVELGVHEAHSHIVLLVQSIIRTLSVFYRILFPPKFHITTVL